MKKTLFRVLSLLLVAVMLLSALIGCQKKDETPADTTAAATEAPSNDVAATVTETEELYDAEGYLKDDLPETYDWQGREYNILSWSEVKGAEWVEEGTDLSKGIRKALYERQWNLQERFKIKFKFNFISGNWGTRADFTSHLENVVNVDAGYYDLVGMYTPTAGLVAQKKLVQDLNSVPYINPEKPWWPQYLSDTITIGDKLYFAAGGISPTSITYTYTVFGNLDLWDTLKMSDQFDGRTVFEVVYDGDWTLEAMLTAGRNAVDDYGDNVVLGCGVEGYEDSFFYGGGFMLLENKNGALQMSDDLTSLRLSNYYDLVQTFFSGEWMDCAPGASPSSFMNGKELFQVAEMGNAPNYTEAVNFKFTSLPMPKCDTEQEDYYTTTGFWMTMYAIPTDVPDNDFAGMMLEGLASESYRTVKDAVYYDYYQSRYTGSEDVDTVKMFDLVMNSVVFDTARMFADAIGMFDEFRKGVQDAENQKLSWSTIYGQNVSTWKAETEKLFAALA